MQTQKDRRETFSGYVLFILAVANIVLVQARNDAVVVWLAFTSIATAALLASRLARDGVFGRGIQTVIAEAPVSLIFGLALALLMGEEIIIRNVADPGILLVSRRILGPLSIGLILIGAEAAVLRKAKLRTTAL